MIKKCFNVGVFDLFENSARSWRIYFQEDLNDPYVSGEAQWTGSLMECLSWLNHYYSTHKAEIVAANKNLIVGEEK